MHKRMTATRIQPTLTPVDNLFAMYLLYNLGSTPCA
jgi:hypothetical protein